jgi:transcription elongation factor Elf1
MNKEIDTYQTNRPVCPHCGATSTDLVVFLDENYGNNRCIECGKWYSWKSDIRFFTDKIDWLERWRIYNRDQILTVMLRELKERDDLNGRQT